MKAILIAAVNVVAFAIPAQAGEWACSAKNIADYSYSGGASAYIRLTMFSTGSSYPVTQDGKDKVSGVTGNGTRFECKRSSAKQ